MEFRVATISDLPEIVQLLADDELGATRERAERPVPDEYLAAFAAITKQDGNSVILAVEGYVILGCLQLTLIPGLARLGMLRAQIEGVRVGSQHRGQENAKEGVQHTGGNGNAQHVVNEGEKQVLPDDANGLARQLDGRDHALAGRNA